METHSTVAALEVHQDERGVLRLKGEVDLATAPILETRLDQANGEVNGPLILDLGEMTFIDCTGLSVLARAQNRLRADDGEIVLPISP